MRSRQPQVPRALLGLLVVVAGLVALVVSYDADEGLPLVPSDELRVEVHDAAQLRAGDPVRIGGARVGTVRRVDAVPTATRPFARVTLRLDSGRRIPVDSTVSVRPLSILGAKAIQLDPGRSPRLVPDGGTLGLRQARPTVDLPDALSLLDAPTRRALRGTVQGLGTGVAGRGASINRTIDAGVELLPRLRSVSDRLADERTRLPRLIAAVDRLLGAVEPVAPVVPDLLGRAATTFAALAVPQARLDALLARTGDVEEQATQALTDARPVLRDATALAAALRPAARRLRPAARALDAALVPAPEALEALRAVAPEADRVALELLRSVPPRSVRLRDSLIGLGDTVRGVRDLTDVALPAQSTCNALGVFLRNGASVIGEGDRFGSWFTFIPVLTPMLLPVSADDDDTHRNARPVLDERGCAAGNTPYRPGRQTGNPADLSTAHEPTVAPPQARRRAAEAGLLDRAPGSRVP